MAGSILLGHLTFLGILILVYGLAIRELFQLYPPGTIWIGWIQGIVGGSILLLCYAVFQWGCDSQWLLVPIALWLGAAALDRFRMASILAMLWITLPLSAFLFLGWQSETGYDPLMPLSVIALVWINDTMAYVSGKLLGKHPLTPRLSPNKTWEGLVGGFMFTLLGGWATHQLSDSFSVPVWLILAAIVSLFSLAGDLFESHLKRRIARKNSGGLLPGHGGILDRFDSLLFVAPVMVLLLIILNGAS